MTLSRIYGTTRTRIAASAALLLCGLTAAPAYAAGSSMPWEAPLQKVLQSIEGPVAKIIAVIIIITTGLALAFGDDAKAAGVYQGTEALTPDDLHEIVQRGAAELALHLLIAEQLRDCERAHVERAVAAEHHHLGVARERGQALFGRQPVAILVAALALRIRLGALVGPTIGTARGTWASTRWTCACATSMASTSATSPTTRCRWKTTSCSR